MRTTLLSIFFAAILGAVSVSKAAEDDGGSVKVALQYEGTQLALSFIDNSGGQSLDFVPDNPDMAKIGVQYKKIGASFGSSVKAQDERYNISSTCRDIQLFYYSKQFGGDLYYQAYKGYYVDTTPVLPEDLYPNLKIRTYTGSLYYKINGNVDLSALSDTLASDKSPKRLLFAIASLSDRAISSDKPLVPAALRQNFPDFVSLKRFHSINPSLSVGYLLPVSWTHTYLNSSLSVGLGYPVLDTNIGLKQSYSIKVNLKIRAGYERGKFSYGFAAVADSDAVEMKNEEAVQFISMAANLFVACKF